MIRIEKIRLSRNPNTEVSEDGKFNVASNGALFYTVDFSNPKNPFGGIKSRRIFQQIDSDGVASWQVDPAAIRSLVGQTVEGNIVTQVVPGYEIGDRIVNSYTTVVFAHETVETVFRQAGHDVSAPVAQPSVVAQLVETEDIAS